MTYDKSAGDGNADCEKDTKARETLPDILESIRRGHRHAGYIREQLDRIDKAYGEERLTKPESGEPTQEPPFIQIVELEAQQLADKLLDLQEDLKRKLNLLFGDRA